MTKTTHSLHREPTMLFELFCYAVAITATLAFFGSPATSATVAPQPESQPQPEPITEPQPIEAPTAPQPIAPAPAMAATIAQPVVSLTIPTEAPKATEAPADLAKLKTPELRRRCTEAGIKWRYAHGKTHLRNAEMIAALTA